MLRAARCPRLLPGEGAGSHGASSVSPSHGAAPKRLMVPVGRGVWWAREVRHSTLALPNQQVTAKLLKELKIQAGECKDNATAAAWGGLGVEGTCQPALGGDFPSRGSGASGCREIRGLRRRVSRCLSPRAGYPIDERRDTTWAPPVLKNMWNPMLDTAGGTRTIPSPLSQGSTRK